MNDLGMMEQSLLVLVFTSWIAILAFAGLRGWNGWLELKRAELELVAKQPGTAEENAAPSTVARIEMADMKERIRKLEAIAAGIDI